MASLAIIAFAHSAVAQSPARTAVTSNIDSDRISALSAGIAVNVVAFGARADGVTDSTIPIQKAIYAAGQGGRVYLPQDQSRPGTGATARAIIAGGAVASINLNAGGTGYARAPYVQIVGGGCQGATAHSTLTGTSVAGIVIDGKGVNCTTPPSVVIVPAARCYLVSQIELLSSTILTGDGETSCLKAKNSGAQAVITNAPIPQPPAFGRIELQTPISITLSNFALEGDGAKTQRGIRLFTNGAGSQNVANAVMQQIWIRGFTVAGVSLSQTYGTLLMGVTSTSNGVGLLLEGDRTHATQLHGQAFNGTTTILGGDFSLNSTGIQLDDWAAEFNVKGAVIESNDGCGLLIAPPYHGVIIEGNHFENNAVRSVCEDINFSFAGSYDTVGSGLAIRNNVFIDSAEHMLRASIVVRSSSNPDITGNSNLSVPPIGCPGAGSCKSKSLINKIVLGNGTITPHVSGNAGFEVQNEAGLPLILEPTNLDENVFSHSSAISNSVWSHNSLPILDDGKCAGCALTDLFPSGAATWRLILPAPSGPENPLFLSQNIGAHPGAYVVAGFWVRLNAGSGTGYVTITTAKASYSGSQKNQPLRVYLDTAWRWVSAGNTLPASDTTESAVGVAIYANSGSGAAYANIVYPQAAIDVINGMPGYVETDNRTAPMEIKGSTIGQPYSMKCAPGHQISGVTLSSPGVLTATCN